MIAENYLTVIFVARLSFTFGTHKETRSTGFVGGSYTKITINFKSFYLK